MAVGEGREETYQQPPRRKARSSRVPWIRIGCGLFSGVVLAQFLFWWLPGVHWDPFHLAPRLPAELSFLVPEAIFSGKIPEAGSNIHAEDQSSKDQGSQSEGKSGVREGNQSNSRVNNQLRVPPDEFTSHGEVALGDRAVEAARSDGVAGSDDNGSGSTEQPPEVEETNPQPITPDEGALANDATGKQLERCVAWLRLLDQTELPERKALANTLYDSLCDVGADLAGFPAESTGTESTEGENEKWKRHKFHLQAARAILSGIATAPEKVVFIASSASELAAADGQGILIAGEIVVIQEQIDGWRITLKDHRRRYVAMIEHEAMKEELHNGDRLIVLGAVAAGDQFPGPQIHVKAAAFVLAPLN